MTLPPPKPGPLPPANQISAKATAAIIDDASVAREVRVAVLHELEACADPETTYKDISSGETLLGPELAPTECDVTARAIPQDGFVYGLQAGYFGAKLPSGAAQAVMQALQRAIWDGRSASQLARLLRRLVTFDPTVMLEGTRATWYYFDATALDQPLNAVTEDIGLRLALPGIHGAHVTGVAVAPFIVIEVKREDLDDPRRPRFTDAGDLAYLEFWRPGGKTAPWKASLTGLDELVHRPVALGVIGGAYALVDCKTN